MTSRLNVTEQLLNDMCMLESIVDDSTHSDESIRFSAVASGQIATQGTLTTELTAYSVGIILDVNGDTLTFTSSINIDKSTLPNGVAEGLYQIAELMRAAAEEVKDNARSKYP